MTYAPDAWVINYTNPMTLCVKALYGVFPEIKVNPVAVNHFTWLTKATYRNIDLFPYYKEFCKTYKDGYETDGTPVDANWANNVHGNKEKVKIDLFNRFGWIAAAGDRHLAEFCEGKWYLESPERVEEY